MGERAREHVLRCFSIERLLRDIEELYEELLENASSLSRGESAPSVRSVSQDAPDAVQPYQVDV
jgi:hypothetical protein